ncbi:DUF4142 domain-containing protein [Achromobacter aloeverae]|uniref:DUF305 domain-containing protein n=1 Tax=Achromobacter aloeverae TaxID=1750518 RepID=A0A4Q1HHW3_9BURK|nr:DUF4142 domain-containing protein [Achromobacter aloeverae]RXN85416.1 DUF305 domain-containing protein [Achromobacter aloeverae]
MRNSVSGLALCACFAVSVPLAASAQTLSGSPKTANESHLASADKSFLEDAAQGGYAEIQGSQMALQKSRNEDVKTFANQMIKDHTAVGEELAALAKSKGYTPPTEPSLMQKGELKALDVTDDSFDSMYARRIGVAAHESTIKVFEKEIKDGKDAEVKAFAQKTLPALQSHLEMAKALQAKVTKK